MQETNIKLAKNFYQVLFLAILVPSKSFQLKRVEGSKTLRTVCLMDATASIYYLLHAMSSMKDLWVMEKKAEHSMDFSHGR
jgi:hypothetical protein